MAGSILSAGGSVPFEKALSSDWADMIDGFQRSALESRLGIPLIYGIDAVHGNNSVYGATIFPHNVGLGATRDPRWGRCYESYSEDTEIVRKMTSIVTGLQGQPPQGHPKGYPFVLGRNNTIACVKHFVGDGGTHKGLNEGNTISSYDDLERIHMAPYLNCISDGVSTVMASYSSWNGSKLHADRFLLTEILKDKLGFKMNPRPTPTYLSIALLGKAQVQESTTILEAIKKAVGDDTEIIYEQYPSAVTLAREDISFAIVAVGEGPYAEFRGDNLELAIPFNGTDVISSVADRLPTLVILISGRPLTLEPWLLEKMDALVAAWLPGSEGEGIADVIFGDYDFEGLLPVSWFKRVEQLPMNALDNLYDPLYPLGYGLTYNKGKSLQ
ncbi:Glycosyl hydrolase family protein isoform 6 [Prunus yedoensis var. nudiflora]|uniref:Glycosyl hydrolase family protein isoform 6 n=1 Tax=Prunus yedoensis var. nudiflora TaxID=2094558 RepID=A0A314XPF5_PRUYE|nr:Glycosyl hydrolase family protein isoform 6 [Prunus yedoensis var. nudiflora]